MATVIDLLRHGEPVGGRRYRGQLDDPLSEWGWEQMWRAASGATPWQGIVSSPLRRCREFAESLGERLGVPLTVDERLREIGFGEWEGKSAAQLKASDPEIISRYYQDPLHNRPPGAEDLDAFLDRVDRAYQDILTRYSGTHLLIIAHAGVIRAVLGRLLGIAPEIIFRINVDTAHISRIRIDRERPPSLMFHGRDRL